jgi:hypothetical protein
MAQSVCASRESRSTTFRLHQQNKKNTVPLKEVLRRAARKLLCAFNMMRRSLDAISKQEPHQMQRPSCQDIKKPLRHRHFLIARILDDTLCHRLRSFIGEQRSRNTHRKVALIDDQKFFGITWQNAPNARESRHRRPNRTTPIRSAR